MLYVVFYQALGRDPKTQEVDPHYQRRPGDLKPLLRTVHRRLWEKSQPHRIRGG
jgi:hypothetical protein